MTNAVLISEIQSAITDEVFYALGLNRRGVLRRTFGWAFSLPTRRFAKIMASIDAAVAKGGIPAGGQMMLDALGVEVEVDGKENIPETNPTIILANHPGAYDSVAIGSQIPRTDLNILVIKTRLYQVLPHIHPHLHYASPDKLERMTALRQAIRHLQKGGILLQFGSGLIDPDPALMAVDKAVFERWSSSIEIFMRKVPEVKIIPTIASHVLLPQFANHFITRLRRKAMDKRRLAEFLQVIQQILFPETVNARPRISFGTPFSLADLETSGDPRNLLPEVLQRVEEQLAYHLDRFEIRSAC
jgi:hypothetical protein